MNISHPAVEVHRWWSTETKANNSGTRDYTERNDRARRIGDALDRSQQAVDDALEAIEPALAEGKFDRIPPELSSKAYMDGVEIWSKPERLRGRHYDSEENMHRIINDDTVMPELLELRQRYLDRSVEAADESEAQSIRNNYLSDALTLVGGRHREGLRSLGPEFDKRMLDARARYKDRLARSRGLGDGGAYKRFADELIEIILDAFAVIDKAEQEVRDRKVITIDRRAPPPEPEVVTDAPAPAAVIEPDRPRVKVLSSFVVDDRPNDRGHGLGREPDPPPAPAPAPAADAYQSYDERVTTAWKTKPPAPRKRKKVQHDLVA